MHLVLFSFWVILSWKYHATWIHCCTARAEDATSQRRQNKPADQGGNIFKVELIHIFVFVQMILFSIRSDLGANLVAGVNAFPVSFSFTPSFMLMRGRRWWFLPAEAQPPLSYTGSVSCSTISGQVGGGGKQEQGSGRGGCWPLLLSSSLPSLLLQSWHVSPRGSVPPCWDSNNPSTWKGALEVCQPVRFPILGKILSLLPVAGCPLQCGRATAILAACCHRTTQQAKGTKSRGKKVSIHPHPLSGGVPDWALCLERAPSAS